MRRVTILLAVGALTLAAAGCGGSNESSTETTTTAVTETTTAETTTTETTATETATATETGTETTTEATGSGSFASGDCLKLLDSSKELTQALSAAGTSSTSMKDAAKLFQTFVDKAPGEIKADLQVLADAFKTYANAIGDLKINPGETPSAETLQKLQQAAASIDSAKVTAASQRLDAWAKKNCPQTG
jgi:ABC-type glycerol-3-phosphate transport system substrate-binding protein